MTASPVRQWVDHTLFQVWLPATPEHAISKGPPFNRSCRNSETGCFEWKICGSVFLNTKRRTLWTRNSIQWQLIWSNKKVPLYQVVDLKSALTRVFEMAKVIPAWLGAMSAWLLKWPEELQALRPIDTDIRLAEKKQEVVYAMSTHKTESWIGDHSTQQELNTDLIAACAHNGKSLQDNWEVSPWNKVKKARATYTTASTILFTALKKSKNIAGPMRPILVISLRTDNTVHLLAIRASDKWLAAAKSFYGLRLYTEIRVCLEKMFLWGSWHLNQSKCLRKRVIDL